MKRFNILLNSTLLVAMVFIAYQFVSNSYNILYIIILAICFYLLFGLLFRRPYILKIGKSVESLFEEKVIDNYSKWSIYISIATIIALIVLFPLAFVLDKSTIMSLLTYIVISYAASYLILIVYVLINIKDAIEYFNKLRSDQESGKQCGKNYIYINKSTYNKYNTNIIGIFNKSEVNEHSKQTKKEKAILENLYDPEKPKNYLPLFAVIHSIYYKKKKFEDDIAEKWYDYIFTQTNGNRDTIRKSYNLKKEKYNEEAKNFLISSIKRNGKDIIEKFEQYNTIAKTLLINYRQYGFTVEEERSEEFKLLCILYLAITIDSNHSPLIHSSFEIHKKTLLQALNNI